MNGLKNRNLEFLPVTVHRQQELSGSQVDTVLKDGRMTDIERVDCIHPMISKFQWYLVKHYEMHG